MNMECDTQSEQKILVETKEGPVCGFLCTNEVGKFNRFHYIPYAEPPIGNLRFLSPVPKKPWTEPLDCTKPPPTYWASDTDYEENPDHIEDCLYLFVTTPSKKSTKLRPVMFWIETLMYHYRIDESLDNSLLVNEDIVFVKAEHRVGVFGFLSANDIIAPGNAGLKDLVMALRWVQRNIESFGGDPNNVTLFGTCSGAALVHFLVLSPMAAGLFHKAIIQSGSALNSWALLKNPTIPLMQLAKELNIESKDSIEIAEILKKMPAVDIARAAEKLTNKQMEETTTCYEGVFAPCVEVEFEGQPAFITKSPDLILKGGSFNHVPIIIGAFNMECAILKFTNNKLLTNFDEINRNARLLVPKNLAGEERKSNEIGRKLIKFYTGGSITEFNREQYLQLISDYYYLYYVTKTAKLHVQMAPEMPVYFYIFNTCGDWKIPLEKLAHFYNSAGHGSDASFLFQVRYKDEPPCPGGRDTLKTRSKVIKLWTNFVKHGNPTPDPEDELLQITWDPVENPHKINYLNIAPDLTKGRNPARERMQFWEELQNAHHFVRTIMHFKDIGVDW